MIKFNRQNVTAIIKGVLFAVILIGIPVYLYLFHRDFFEMFNSVSEIEDYINRYKGYGALFLIAAQIVQIIICIIPGQPFQFAAGYMYGSLIAVLISIVGAFIGASITFYLAKLLGRDALNLFFGEKKVVKYIEKLDTKNGFLVLFILYFIPGFPKDAVSYLAGLSKIKWGSFIVIATIARIPAMCGSVLIGTFTKDQQYGLIAVVAVLVVSITCFCTRHKDRILDWSDKAYEKLRKL